MRTRRHCAEPKVEQPCEGCCSKMPQFFKVLIGDFKERLRIPPAFMKHVAIKESGRAVLEDQFSRCWDIEILRVGNDMIFKEGWEKFVERNDLETGDFLVFRYKRELRFAVTIFDKSACQKELNSCDISASLIIDLTHHEDHGENSLPPFGKRERRRVGPSNAWNAASSFKSTNPTFTKFVTNPSRTQMNVPISFSSAYLPREGPTLLKFQNQNSMRWTVKYHNKFHTLTAGWHQFCLENHLKKGDVCVFELMNEQLEFNVHIFRRSATPMQGPSQ